MKKDRELGIVIYGATGYTGKLVADYMNKKYGVNGAVSWAIAGRSLEKLEAIRDELGISGDLPLVLADAADPATLHAMAARANLTARGPCTMMS